MTEEAPKTPLQPRRANFLGTPVDVSVMHEYPHVRSSPNATALRSRTQQQEEKEAKKVTPLVCYDDSDSESSDEEDLDLHVEIAPSAGGTGTGQSDGTDRTRTAPSGPSGPTETGPIETGPTKTDTVTVSTGAAGTPSDSEQVKLPCAASLAELPPVAEMPKYFRVKVYLLDKETSEWQDKGTGRLVQIQTSAEVDISTRGGALLLHREDAVPDAILMVLAEPRRKRSRAQAEAEEKQKQAEAEEARGEEHRVLMRETIGLRTTYERQEPTIISWSSESTLNAESTEWALSFQDNLGCQVAFDAIERQQELLHEAVARVTPPVTEALEDEVEEASPSPIPTVRRPSAWIHENAMRQDRLPKPKITTLAAILDVMESALPQQMGNPFAPYPSYNSRAISKVNQTLKETTFLDDLFDLFDRVEGECEGALNAETRGETLGRLFGIARCLLQLEVGALEELLKPGTFMRLLGLLEYGELGPHNVDSEDHSEAAYGNHVARVLQDDLWPRRTKHRDWFRNVKRRVIGSASNPSLPLPDRAERLVEEMQALKYLRDVVLLPFLEDPQGNRLSARLSMLTMELMERLIKYEYPAGDALSEHSVSDSLGGVEELGGGVRREDAFSYATALLAGLREETNTTRLTQMLDMLEDMFELAKTLAPSAREDAYDGLMTRGLMTTVHKLLLSSRELDWRDKGYRVWTTCMDIILSITNYDVNMVRQYVVDAVVAEHAGHLETAQQAYDAGVPADESSEPMQDEEEEEDSASLSAFLQALQKQKQKQTQTQTESSTREDEERREPPPRPRRTLLLDDAPSLVELVARRFETLPANAFGAALSSQIAEFLRALVDMQTMQHLKVSDRKIFLRQMYARHVCGRLDEQPDIGDCLLSMERDLEASSALDEEPAVSGGLHGVVCRLRGRVPPMQYLLRALRHTSARHVRYHACEVLAHCAHVDRPRFCRFLVHVDDAEENNKSDGEHNDPGRDEADVRADVCADIRVDILRVVMGEPLSAEVLHRAFFKDSQDSTDRAMDRDSTDRDRDSTDRNTEDEEDRKRIVAVSRAWERLDVAACVPRLRALLRLTDDAGNIGTALLDSGAADVRLAAVRLLRACLTGATEVHDSHSATAFSLSTRASPMNRLRSQQHQQYMQQQQQQQQQQRQQQQKKKQKKKQKKRRHRTSAKSRSFFRADDSDSDDSDSDSESDTELDAEEEESTQDVLLAAVVRRRLVLKLLQVAALRGATCGDDSALAAPTRRAVLEKRKGQAGAASLLQSAVLNVLETARARRQSALLLQAAFDPQCRALLRRVVRGVAPRFYASLVDTARDAHTQLRQRHEAAQARHMRARMRLAMQQEIAAHKATGSDSRSVRFGVTVPDLPVQDMAPQEHPIADVDSERSRSSHVSDASDDSVGADEKDEGAAKTFAHFFAQKAATKSKSSEQNLLLAAAAAQSKKKKKKKAPRKRSSPMTVSMRVPGTEDGPSPSKSARVGGGTSQPWSLADIQQR